ncbi:GNAT family N-acetyltransferase [Paenibacillus caui]|uniref:GNAT family N-acetyltransferase n=1 Tax=Paenibacillus caui TaxID=2873927 RepID=UPI001CA9730D|nr:GNAT family N-acetyltransferase [Paenibacillus caui]
MHISSIHPEDVQSWEKFHGTLLAFIRKYGSKRITADAYRRIQRLSPLALSRAGNGIMMATICAEDGRRIAGILCTEGYGDDLSVAVVHPLYRGRGIGTRLLKGQLAELGRLNCKVAIDNISILRMCFKAGLSACNVAEGPTGKPTLVLSGKRHEILVESGS